MASYVPHDGFETEFTGDAKDGRAARAEGWTEKIGMFADDIVKNRSALRELAADFQVTPENQDGVSKGVVADDVASLGDGAGDGRFLVDVASDEKKSCVHVVFRQDFEQTESVWVVRTIVVGQGELA